MAEQKRNTRNSKSTKIQPVNDYGRIQPQAPELEEAVLGALMCYHRSCGEPETGGYSDCKGTT